MKRRSDESFLDWFSCWTNSESLGYISSRQEDIRLVKNPCITYLSSTVVHMTIILSNKNAGYFSPRLELPSISHLASILLYNLANRLLVITPKVLFILFWAFAVLGGT